LQSSDHRREGDATKEIISREQFGSESKGQSRESTTSGLGANPTNRAGAAVSNLSDAAQYATEKAKQSAFDAAGTVTHQVKGLLDGQVASGADMIGHLAKSTRRAADELDRDAPQLAGLVRGAADQIDGLAGNMRDQTVDELLRTASDFTRRKPALVFGLASLAGFFVFRVLKSAASGASTSSHPYSDSQQGRSSTFHGA
jgi:ABC-type transporter Mla subunit MlaD